jgi:EAL domain-containing protein (putative c-di-GMP-specific phosphodiesterase class I)/CHASE2 domain-containing sensor protein/GGDEF domain-containing protein
MTVMTWPPHVLGRMRRSVPGLAFILIVVAIATTTGALRPLDDAFARLRFASLHREPSRVVTVVEIDVKSLRASGRWPWGRERFATALANLHKAGATVIGFDVDFSARSAQAGDRALADAIHAQAGAIVLPTFVQQNRGDPERRLVESTPLRDLTTDALLASVNVPIDTDGRVRRYAYGFNVGETYRPSMAAMLAGTVRAGHAGDFLIDYSVDAKRLDHLSFEDVYENRFDPAKVRGRAVLIGATALELGDEFATPQSAVLPGVYIHALAAENLATGRALAAPRPVLIMACVLLMAFLLRPTRRGATLRSLGRRHTAAFVLATVTPVALQALAPISVPGGAFALTQVICLLWLTRVELARRAQAIVEEREAGLLHLAMHEPETELPNRRALVGELEAELSRQAHGVAVVALGLDRYALMRSALGYSRSNQIVRAVARRIAETLPEAKVAHLSTSVLGLVVAGPDDEVVEAALRRLTELDPCYNLDGHSIDVFMRAGVILATMQPDATAEFLLERASIALDDARRLNRKYVAFDPGAYVDPTANLSLMSEMAAGLPRGELSLHYQPKVAARTGLVHGAEALIRWRHPQRGPIPPDAFIVTAEETGVIRLLTEWTVTRALDDSAALRKAGHDLLISVNISGRLLSDESFCERVLQLVGPRGGEMCFEITETAVIEHPDEARRAIAGFHCAGIKVSIDDYGVGLSSLSYLKMLDANELKVDKSLVVDVASSQRDRLILKSTVDLAHGLGMAVVAEGVETEAVRAALVGIGCDSLQGYLFSKPLPLAELQSLLQAWSQAPARARPAGRPKEKGARDDHQLHKAS